MLKEKRRKAGFSQRELADLAGVSFRAVQEWESKGTERALAGKLVRVARVLGCSVEELLS